ncbi:hypothetical protein [Sphaerisporangium sp. TRM90804]|uniref:hypothetical protein n=1 Tax=Sphaerisporangium sp. TRM90804 TaxID=3031113 RepID=UPI00244C7DDC|nr:hypothetical protein [Sphaerisporangium sp. TRM90804]MDH2424828.1 hypothetical protein [Sphaerisporangium sp. TRM90804]
MTDIVPDLEYDDADEVLALGETPCELPSIGALAKALGEHGIELPVDVARRLAEDHGAEGDQFAGRPATGLLAAMSTVYAGPEQAARIEAALTGQETAPVGEHRG